MNALETIHQLYQPFQPSAAASDPNIHYEEKPPCHLLRPFIYCYWELRTLKKLDYSFRHTVITDGCMDIYFETSQPGKTYIMGLSEQFEAFSLAPRFHYYGIRFMPAIFPQLYKLNASEFTNKRYELAQIAPLTSKFIANNFENSISFSDAIPLFNEHFTQFIQQTKIQIDTRFYDALYEIMASNGTNSLDAIQTGLSQRQLQRLFNQYIGTPPKRFSKIIRFQKLIQEIKQSENSKSNNIHFDLGYYDQAHFIKEFKLYTGHTPKQLIQQGTNFKLNN